MPLPPEVTSGGVVSSSTGLMNGAASASINVDLSALHLIFPGAVRLDAHGLLPSKVPNALLNQLNAALMPLNPIFDTIDGVLAAVEVIDALANLNLVKVGEALAKLAQLAGKLLQYLPQAAVPLLIVRCLDLLVGFILVLKSELLAMVTFQLSVDAAQNFLDTLGVGPAKTALQGAVANARVNLSVSFGFTKAKAAPLNRLIKTLNLIGGLVGLPKIPSIDELSSDLSQAVEELDTVVSALQAVRSLIPVP